MFNKVGMAIVLLCTNVAIAAGHGDGNGGDLIRSYFIDRGKTMLEFLKENPHGQSFVDEFNLVPVQLDLSLTTKRIRLTDEELVDNTQSLVDSRIAYEEGVVYLNRQEWKEYIIGGVDLDMMIFHEMLRAARVLDDDYIVSRPFIKIYRDAREQEVGYKERIDFLKTVIVNDQYADGESFIVESKVFDHGIPMYRVIGDPKHKDFYQCVDNLSALVSGSYAIDKCKYRDDLQFQACVLNLSSKVSASYAVDRCRIWSDPEYQECFLILSQSVLGSYAESQCVSYLKRNAQKLYALITVNFSDLNFPARPPWKLKVYTPRTKYYQNKWSYTFNKASSKLELGFLEGDVYEQEIVIAIILEDQGVMFFDKRIEVFSGTVREAEERGLLKFL